MLYSDRLLDALRREGDPSADRVVSALVDDPAVGRLLQALLQNDQAVPSELPDSVAAWLDETGHLPYWANQRRLERGAAFFAAHGVLISLILATDSLVECYAARKGVKVLTATYRMAQNPYRRIAETAQWVLLVMAPGGLCPGGQGIRATQKVRLMHAAIRHLLSKSWDVGSLGVPICQEDLAGTLMAFSYVVLRGLRRLGVAVTEAEAEDFLYIWRAVGEMIGIRPSLIPVNMAEAQALTETIFRRHHGPSPEGALMTRALLEMHARMLPGELFDGIFPALLRFLAGDQVADWMEVPHTPWESVVARLGGLVGAAENRTELLRLAAGRLGVAMLQATAIAMTDYERATFTVPPILRQRWKL